MGKNDALASVEDAADFGATVTGDKKAKVVGAILDGIEMAGFDILIGRIQGIDDTLATVILEVDGEFMTIADAGKRKEALRGMLKEGMGKAQKQRVVDEESGYSAKLNPSYSDEWHPDELRKALKPRQRTKVFVEKIDHKALDTLISTGAVSRAALEVAGAVTKKLRSVALFIRPIKDDRDDDSS